MSAIFHGKPSVSVVARHGLTDGQYQTQFSTQLPKGLLTGAVTGYEEGDAARFAAYWTKP